MSAPACGELATTKRMRFLDRNLTLWTEESPNDFDKNHKFKVDAHLVM
ncbi:hypothetical protein NMD15_16165 (plasmid) [Plesiomonas shigelloides]